MSETIKLKPLLESLPGGAGRVLSAHGDWTDVEVAAVQDDSRRVAPGTLFVAIEGLTVDGHDFAAGAEERGAVAVVGSRVLKGLGVPVVVVEDPARVLALCAARLAGDPASAMTLMGITGTNGKTTTTYLMEAILAEAAHRPGVIGTVAYRYGGRDHKAPFTTPTPIVLQQVLREMRDTSCSHVVIEVSSHALELGRVWGLTFDVAAFTHLTQDHLDLHGSMEAYLQAKLLLFSRHLAPGGTAVINLDGHGADEVWRTAAARGDLKLLGCSSQGHADAEATLLGARHTMEGMSACLRIGGEEVEISSPLVGAYNADNILMAAACCHEGAGIDLETVARGIAAVRGVPGRLERVTEPSAPFAVLVDYAHTPDALARAMEVLKPLCRGRLLVVFGCGGDRDRSKRPLMGGNVARCADLALVTSDNPRTEDPQAIIDAILAGVRAEGIPELDRLDDGRKGRSPAARGSGATNSAARGFIVEPDRRTAIAAAIQTARRGDIVLIAGKGHEDYQILGTERIHFDDREEARKALGSGGRSRET
jgi:UDP-N-acetylmuramyl-tripeptide synthetase